MIEIHGEGNNQPISTSSAPSSTESDEMSVFIPNDEKIDTVSMDLDLMRLIDDLNRNLNQTGIDPIHQTHVNYAHILTALELTIKSMESNESETQTIEETMPDFCVDSEQRKHQIQTLWNKYRTIFPEEHVHMWSSLENGLAEYLTCLKKREKLHNECDGLRRQNAQLKYMLQELL